MTDGSTATETLTEYDPGRSFAYELTDFTNVLGRLVSGVRGEWTFSPDGSGTLIRWTYDFKPRAACHGPIRVGLGPLWRRYMLAALTGTVEVIEHAGRMISCSNATNRNPLTGW
ncbi:SRPBCC family protein [Saccharopolyspora aridisoli]|uniref:SRPBCC family protein n=1 Tax=Saccharopolyspora aridisoli TaxID=2530385 RepID=UPI001A9DAA06